MKHKKNMNAVVGGLVGVLVIGGLIAVGVTKKEVKPEPVPVVEEVPEAKVTAPKRKSVTSDSSAKTGITVTSVSSYEDNLKRYAGMVIQFNQNCQAKPTVQTFKKGATVMLDNRSNQTRKISIGTSSMTLLPYAFGTANLSVAGTFGVDCDNSINVATLTVQE